MTRIKICGITNLKDALAVAAFKPHALGFIFYRPSPRYISPREAKEIIAKVPAVIQKVGVFVNAKEKTVKRIAGDLKLDILQFHGGESPQFCRRFKKYKIIKVIRVKDRGSLKNIQAYRTWGVLFDTYRNNLYGGSSRRFAWELLKGLKSDKEIFLSGGLNPANVQRAIEYVRPSWVDVSSSLERKPGRKDIKKVEKFIQTVRAT